MYAMHCNFVGYLGNEHDIDTQNDIKSHARFRDIFFYSTVPGSPVNRICARVSRRAEYVSLQNHLRMFVTLFRTNSNTLWNHGQYSSLALATGQQKLS